MEDQFHAIIAWQNSGLYLRLNHVLVQLHCGHKESLSGFLIEAHARAAIACGKFNGLPPICPSVHSVVCGLRPHQVSLFSGGGQDTLERSAKRASAYAPS